MFNNIRITLLLLFCSVWLSCDAKLILQDIVDHVNRANVSWKAGHNDFVKSDSWKAAAGTWSSLDHDDKRFRMIKHKYVRRANETGDDSNSMPESFDARRRWFLCESIGRIWNQGNCAADWAIAVTSVINDRICIKSRTNITASYSPQKLLSCCSECGDGCNGGYSRAAWNYWAKKGLVTGGDYGSNEGCQPWLVPPCNQTIFRTSTSTYTCGKYRADTPKCQLDCYNSKYPKSFRQDIIKGARLMELDPFDVRSTLMKQGPVTATMRVYEDFLSYSGGVYYHVAGRRIGTITVKVIGWGIDYRSGLNYWLAANSWGTSWGQKGFFKIRRGNNDCLFEDSFFAGSPVLSNVKV